MKSIVKSALLGGIGAALAATSAMGAFTFTNGDLIMGFQAAGGQGATKNVFFNLGAATNFRDTPNLGSLGNISTTLSATYGPNWYSRTDLWFGVIGNLNQQPTSGIGSRAPVNGDPSRTIYASAPTLSLAGAQLIAAGTYGSSALGAIGGNLSGMEAMIVTLTTQSDGAAVLDKDSQPVEWNNSWSEWNPTPGAAFENITGGIQQNFGKAGSKTYVDLQRILATNTGANPTGIVGGGTYETTFTISNTGAIASIPEASTSLLALAAGALVTLRRRRA
jgi:hypothetical protein